MTVADFIAYFPEFADVEESRITSALTRAANLIDPNDTCRWGASAGLLAEGTANLVAHYLVTSPAPGEVPKREANDITSEDRPTLKFTRDSKLLHIQSNDPFMKSEYGQQYVYLRDYIVGKGAVAV